MNKWMMVAAALLSLSVLPTGVEAKGCVKGAAVGGVAGHFVGKGHAVAGAAAGCAIGHHEANKNAKKAAQQKNSDQTQPPNGSDQTRNNAH